MAAPTIVLQEVSSSSEETGYRVLLARGADIFGEWDEHVAETFVPEQDSLDEAVRELRQQLEGGAEEPPVDDDGPLDHDDVEDLRRAFEEHDTIKAAAERFELGYGAVRQRMIDAGIYEPRTYDTGGGEPDDEDEEEEDEEQVYFTSSASGRIGKIHRTRECSRINKVNVENIREKPRGVLEGHKEKCSFCWPDEELEGQGIDVGDLERVYEEEDGNVAAVARRFDVRYEYIYRDLVENLIHEPDRMVTDDVQDDIAGLGDDEEAESDQSPLAGDDSPHKYSTGEPIVARDYSNLPEANGTLRGLDVKVPDGVTADAVRTAVWSGECRTILDVAEHVGLEVDRNGHGLGAMRTILHRLDLYEDLQDPEGYELPKGVAT